jgi:hypothetical protein
VSRREPRRCSAAAAVELALLADIAARGLTRSGSLTRFTCAPWLRLCHAPQEGERLGPDAVPSVPSRAPFSWLGPVLRVSDDALLPEVGLDAVLYIKFARLVRRWRARHGSEWCSSVRTSS